MFVCKKHFVITIGRSFGSGGREIGKKVADELSIPFYDKELLEAEARASDICIDYLHKYDEKRPDFFVYSMAFNPYFVRNDEYEPLEITARHVQKKVIQDAARQGSCVIVGRRADKILREEYDTLNVFVTAPLEKRIERVMKRNGFSEKDSKKVIQKADRSRRAFYNYFDEGNWGDAENYNLCIDSGALGIEKSAAMILEYLRLTDRIA